MGDLQYLYWQYIFHLHTKMNDQYCKTLSVCEDMKRISLCLTLTKKIVRDVLDQLSTDLSFGFVSGSGLYSVEVLEKSLAAWHIGLQ